MWTVLFVAPIFQANFVTPLLALLLAINIREARRSVGANPLTAAAVEGGSSLVAAVIGKSVPAVRVIQHRALGNLRKIMQG
jgi:hypothetical protein